MAATLNDRDITRIFYIVQNFGQMLASMAVADGNRHFQAREILYRKAVQIESTCQGRRPNESLQPTSRCGWRVLRTRSYLMAAFDDWRE